MIGHHFATRPTRQHSVLALALVGAAAVVASLGACRSSSETSPEANTASNPTPHGASGAVAPARDSVRDLVDTLSRLTVMTSADENLVGIARKGSMDEVIDALLSDDRFAQIGAEPLLYANLFDLKSEAANNLIGLQTARLSLDGSSHIVYYLHEPCGPKDAVKVRPWWDQKSEVYVCSDSYRPTTRVDAINRQACGSKNHLDQINLARNAAAEAIGKGNAQHSPKPSPLGRDACGCGPELIFCAPDAQLSAEIAAALRSEVSDTIAYVVGNDLPYKTLFLSNETVHGPLSKLLYTRSLLLEGKRQELPDLSGRTTAWQARPEHWPGQQSGLLTTYHLLHMTDGVRDRMRDFFDIAWCANPGSHGAAAETVFSLGITNLRDGDGWQKLAAMPFCTGCHARLDYGMQFFTGYPSSYQGAFALADKVQNKSGPFYGDDIDDERGRRPRTPHDFGELIVSQPEFAQCAIDRVANHVFSRRATPADIDALREDFAAHGTIKSLMRTALRRYAASWSEQAPALPPASVDSAVKPTQSLATAPAATDDTVAVNTQLRGRLDDHCISCHDGSEEQGAPTFDLTRDSYPRTVIQNLLHHVAWQNMPKDEPLAVPTRVAFTRELIELLWPPGTERETASAYYLRANALPSHRATTVARTFPEAAKLRLTIEYGVKPSLAQLSPGLLSSLAVAALRTCATSADRDACLAQFTDPHVFANARLSEPITAP